MLDLGLRCEKLFYIHNLMNNIDMYYYKQALYNLLYKNKRIVFYLTIIGITLLQSCGPSEREVKQAEYEQQMKINVSKFYYPKTYDDYWRTYQPRLKGAEGWITNDCRDSINSGKKVIIISESLNHKGWGSYEGQLSVEFIESGEKTSIDFVCFKPDFSVGEWLSK